MSPGLACCPRTTGRKSAFIFFPYRTATGIAELAIAITTSTATGCSSAATSSASPPSSSSKKTTPMRSALWAKKKRKAESKKWKHFQHFLPPRLPLRHPLPAQTFQLSTFQLPLFRPRSLARMKSCIPPSSSAPTPDSRRPSSTTRSQRSENMSGRKAESEKLK